MPGKEGEGDPRERGTRALAGRRRGRWSGSGHGDVDGKGETAGKREQQGQKRKSRPPAQAGGGE